MARKLVTHSKSYFSPLAALLLIRENPIPVSPKKRISSFGYTILPSNYLNDPNGSYKKKMNGLLYFSVFSYR
jgi:hypothetical protein